MRSNLASDEDLDPEGVSRYSHRSKAGRHEGGNAGARLIGESALGVESLERFVRREPLRRVHECVFGVLALESEPVDPRL
jgi:hypothetical protein